MEVKITLTDEQLADIQGQVNDGGGGGGNEPAEPAPTGNPALWDSTQWPATTIDLTGYNEVTFKQMTGHDIDDIPSGNAYETRQDLGAGTFMRVNRTGKTQSDGKVIIGQKFYFTGSHASQHAQNAAILVCLPNGQVVDGWPQSNGERAHGYMNGGSNTTHGNPRPTVPADGDEHILVFTGDNQRFLFGTTRAYQE